MLLDNPFLLNDKLLFFSFKSLVNFLMFLNKQHQISLTIFYVLIIQI